MQTSSGTAFLMARMARCTDPLVVPRLAADLVLLLGQAEQDDRRDAQSCAIASASRASSSTEKWNWPGSDGISAPDALARTDEERKDEVVRGEGRLADQAAMRGRAAQATGPGFGEGHAPQSLA